MALPDTTCSEAHLAVEDSHLVFAHADEDTYRRRRLATSDVSGMLVKRGVTIAHIADERAKAVGVVRVTTDNAGGSVALPEGMRLVDLTSRSHGVTSYVVDEATVLDRDGGVHEVAVTAEDFGEPFNLPAGTALYVAGGMLAGIATVALKQASGGVDHVLARATTYRALELFYGDLARSKDDTADYRAGKYGRRYHDEVDALVARGFDTGVDLYGSKTTDHGMVVLDRGG
jgi:hypothetical protein